MIRITYDYLKINVCFDSNNIKMKNNINITRKYILKG